MSYSRLVVLWILSVNTESIIVATELGIKEEKCVQEKEIISCYDKETQIWHPGLRPLREMPNSRFSGIALFKNSFGVVPCVREEKVRSTRCSLDG